MKVMSNKTKTIEERKHSLRLIITEAMDTIAELKEQMDGIEEKTECAKLLIDDLVMLKSEATIELLRIKLSEVLEFMDKSNQEEEEEEELE